MEMEVQKFCLKWDGFQRSVTSLLDSLRQDGELVDITLCCDGQQVQAHRMMLSACSPYFRELLKCNPCQQMVIFLKDTSAADLHAIIEFMYKGSVNVVQSQLASFIKTAEMLQIRGLSGDDDKAGSPHSLAEARAPPTAKRRRTPGSASAGRRPPLSPLPRPLPRPLPPSPPAATGRPADPPGASELSAAPRSSPSPPAPRSSPSPPAPLSSQAPSAPLSSQAPSAPLSSLVPAAPVSEKEPPLFKVEPIDLADHDVTGEPSMDATLGYLSDFETGYSEQPLVAMATADAAATTGCAGGWPPESGGGGGGEQCSVCGVRYLHRRNLAEHMKKHRGQTTCPLCQQQFAMTFTLRRHMANQHRLAAADVSRLTNKRGCERLS